MVKASPNEMEGI